ncbi:MAG: hypothetical protein ACFE9Q_08185 [Candidatus Hodarchaeota archaeon]
MDVFNIIKIITAILNVIIAFTVGFRVLSLNPRDLLNIWFTLFFISSSLGFLIYTIYHLILNNPQIIIPIMITAHIFFNFIFISLMMTVFILEKFKKVAMSLKYLGSMIVLFFIMSVGYFIWKPELDMVRYAQDIVDTNTPIEWHIFITLVRIALSIFVVYKYALITKKVEEQTRKKVQWFFIGIIFAIIGMFVNLIGGFLRSIIIEILALIIIDVGTLSIFRGFLLK